jgi:hypothetical protein
MEHFNDEQMNELCSTIGINPQSFGDVEELRHILHRGTTIGINPQIFGDGNKSDKVNSLVSYAEKFGYTDWLLKEAFTMYKNWQSAPTQESA